MPELQGPQFHELAGRLAEPDGGFSVRPKTGKEPRTGFMVSQAGTERKYGPSTTVSGRQVQTYAGAQKTDLDKQGRHLGGWHNPETHDKDLDVSRHFVDHDRARSSMWSNNQDALFDLNRGHSERNFAKLGTAGSSIGHFLHADPDPPAEYDELQKAGRQRLNSRRVRPGGASR